MRSHRLWYLVLLAIVALFNLFFYQYLSYCAMWLAIILPVPFLGLLLYTRTQITVRLETTVPAAARDSALPFSIVVENKGWVPLTCGKLRLTFDNNKTGEHFEEEFPFSLRPHTTKHIDWSVVSRHCGRIAVGVKRAKILDLLGLFSLSLRVHSELGLLSYPRIVPTVIDAPKVSSQNPEALQYAQWKSGSDPSETFGIREYRPGDPPRSVHWKLSGKFDRLMVRQFSEPASQTLLMLLEPAGTQNFPILLDALLDVYATLSQSFLANAVPFESLWYDPRTGRLEGRESSSAMDAAQQQTAFLEVPPYDGISRALQAFLHLPAKPYSHILYLTARVSLPECRALCEKNPFSHITILYFCPEGELPADKAADIKGATLIPLHPGRLSEELLTLEL